jgi:formylglycine-generating enzyme required for sulfatase activity
MFKQLALCTLLSPCLTGAVDFVRDVKPILEFNCVSCHQASKDKGDLRLDTYEQMLKCADGEPVIIVGKPLESLIYTTTVLAADDDDVMPPTKRMHVLSEPETEILKNWIKEGAQWPKEVALQAQKNQLPAQIDFVSDIQPILEYSCISCHGSTKDKGDLRLDTKAFAFKANSLGDPCLVPGKPLESSFYTLILLTEENDEDDMMMPPAKARKKGQIVTYRETALIRKWIEQGAVFPVDAELKPKTRPSEEIATAGISPTDLYRKLGFEKLAGKIQHGKSYSNTITDTEIKYEMVAIPGGKYTRGGSEAGEGPKKEINIDPFWMQKYELSWDQYEVWQFNIDIKNRDEKTYQINPNDAVADVVSRPTGPYLDMSFGMGKKNRPAVCMTQLAAKAYCMWLSAKTGHFYRLATEAEWEYACRAGTTTKYHFGNDESKIDEYGWYYDNTDGDGYKERGIKKPNAWGLYDMHGNVAEWVLDSFDPEFYKNGPTDNPVCLAAKDSKLNPGVEAPWPNKLYGRVARGGSWDDDVGDLRSASRKLSEPEWKIRDPQLPKSVWYHTDATAVGFRIVRAARIPALKDMPKYWPSEEEIIAIPPR